jgi:hypothetical protein
VTCVATSLVSAQHTRSTLALMLYGSRQKTEPGPIADVSRVCSGRGSLGLSCKYQCVVGMRSLYRFSIVARRIFIIGILLYRMSVPYGFIKNYSNQKSYGVSGAALPRGTVTTLAHVTFSHVPRRPHTSTH